jgi:hypothetical protein
VQTRIVKDEHPCLRCLPREPGDEPDPRDALRGSRRRNELWSAARNDLWLCRPSVAVAARLWRPVVPRLRPNRTESQDQGRFPRRLVKRRRTGRPEAPSTDKRALASSRPPRRCCHRHDGPGGPSTESHEGIRARSRTHAQPQPCVCTSIGRPSAGICKQPEARARPAKRPNLARAGTFSAPARCLKKAASRETPGETGLAPRRRLSREPANDQSARARGTEANWRPPSAHVSPPDPRRRLVHADVCRLAKARLESSHANATTFSEP